MIPDFITKVWGDLPSNQPGAVGKALLLPIVREDINGKGFFIAGNKIIDLEDTVREKQPQWMGQELSDKVNEGQRRMGIE
jgi:hypothetical protein